MLLSDPEDGGGAEMKVLAGLGSFVLTGVLALPVGA
jgi:hypothetical protein